MSSSRGPLTFALFVITLGAGVDAAAPAAVSADSFAPVRMAVKISSVARRDRPLAVQVTVIADPGALDVRSGALRARVKLSAGECGGDFEQTTGTVLMDRPLSPQPDPGEAYQGRASGSARPTGYGAQTVCAYLQDDFKQFASDTTDSQVDVSRPCTVAAARYDRAAAARSRTATHRRLVATLRRRARSACGPGVAL